MSVRCEARAFAIFRALRDTCLCLAIGIIVSVGVRGVSPGCCWCREMGSQVAGVELDEPQEASGVVLLVWIARARSQRLMSRKDRGARSGRSGSQGQGPETQAAGSTGRVVYEYTCELCKVREGPRPKTMIRKERRQGTE